MYFHLHKCVCVFFFESLNGWSGKNQGKIFSTGKTVTTSIVRADGGSTGLARAAAVHTGEPTAKFIPSSSSWKFRGLTNGTETPTAHRVQLTFSASPQSPSRTYRTRKGRERASVSVSVPTRKLQRYFNFAQHLRYAWRRFFKLSGKR